MKPFIGILLILALALGLTACGGGTGRKAEGITNTYELEEPFSDISIDTTILDVVIVPSEDGSSVVTCQEADTLLHDVYVKDGTLFVKRRTDSKNASYNNIPLKIEVSIPAGEYGDLSIETTSGDQYVAGNLSFRNGVFNATSGGIGVEAAIRGGIRTKTTSGGQFLRDMEPEKVEAESTSGSIQAENLTHGQFYEFETTSGSVILIGVLSDRSLEVETTSGDVQLIGCDAGSIEIETSSGDVTGSLLSGKAFDVRTSSGAATVPADDPMGGTCSIRTSSGNVLITID